MRIVSIGSAMMLLLTTHFGQAATYSQTKLIHENAFYYNNSDLGAYVTCRAGGGSLFDKDTGTKTCNATDETTVSRTFDAFDTSLGTLNSVEVSYEFDMDLRAVIDSGTLLGDGATGRFRTGFEFNQNGTVLADNPIDPAGTFSVTENDALKETKTYNFERRFVRSFTVDATDFQASEAARMFDFTLFLYAEVERKDGCRTREWCRATLDVTNLSLDSIKQGSAYGPLPNYGYMRATFDYTEHPDEPDPTPAVPLPASGLVLIAGLGALSALRRRKGSQRD